MCYFTIKRKNKKVLIYKCYIINFNLKNEAFPRNRLNRTLAFDRNKTKYDCHVCVNKRLNKIKTIIFIYYKICDISN